MTDVPATGVVGHQDYGTGLASTEDVDPDNAAFFAADNIVTQWVDTGLTFTVDHTNDTLDIAAGRAWLEYTGSVTVTTTPSTDAADWNTSWQGPITFPVSVAAETGISLDASATNEVWLFIDETQNDSVSYRVGSGESAPSEPSMKIGEVDTSNDTKDEDFNRHPDLTVDSFQPRTVSGIGHVDYPQYAGLSEASDNHSTIQLGPNSYGDVNHTGALLGAGFDTKVDALTLGGDSLAFFLALQAGATVSNVRGKVQSCWSVQGGITHTINGGATTWTNVSHLTDTIDVEQNGCLVQNCVNAIGLTNTTVNLNGNDCVAAGNAWFDVVDNGTGNQVGLNSTA